MNIKNSQVTYISGADHALHWIIKFTNQSRLSVKSTVHHTLVLALTNCKQQRSPSYLVLEAAGEFSMLALLTILLLRETIN